MRRDRPSWQCRSRKRELPGHGRVTAQQGQASPGTRVTRAREPLLLGSTPGYRHGAGTSSLPLTAQDARPAAMRGETRSQADATGCAQRLRQTPSLARAETARGRRGGVRWVAELSPEGGGRGGRGERPPGASLRKHEGGAKGAAGRGQRPARAWWGPHPAATALLGGARAPGQAARFLQGAQNGSAWS